MSCIVTDQAPARELISLIVILEFEMMLQLSRDVVVRSSEIQFHCSNPIKVITVVFINAALVQWSLVVL